MISAKRLLQMAKKWQKAATLGRKRISWESKDAPVADAKACNKLIADKGHFIVYSSEGKRFMVPLAFLTSTIFEELLRMSEEEFGSQANGPITLPCDAAFLEHVLHLLRTRVSRDVQRQMLMSIVKTEQCSRSSLCILEQSQLLAVF